MLHKNDILRIFLFAATVIALLFLYVRISIALRQTPTQQVRYGITFSTNYAGYLGLDPMKAYQDLVENLGVRAVRFPVYWPDIEPSANIFEWKQLDEFIKYSEQHHVKLTLAIGRKVPRWPECFVPNWAEKRSEDDQQKAVLQMIREVILRYKNSPAIERWQLENEPLLPFGVCQTVREKDLREEVAYIKALDTHPILITASGEMQPWGLSAQLSDVFGISVYRTTWNSVFGYFTYPLSPLFYRFRLFPFHQKQKNIIVSELQAEPWFSEDVKKQPISYWSHIFSADQLVENVEFVKEMGLSEVYFWGAEWWEYLKQNGDDHLWNKAKEYFMERN